jgi:hypothetical protein
LVVGVGSYAILSLVAATLILPLLFASLAPARLETARTAS